MLLCPVLTLILHPLIGSWSDRMGRKIPMVTAALFGYYFTIIAYGVSETAHDLLYTLGRALTHDHAADLEGGLQQITSEFSAVMKCGRLLGFLISVFHVEAILLQWNKDDDHDHDTEQRVIPANLEQLGCGDQLDDNLIDTALHSKILFGVVFFFWTASTIGVMLFVTDKKQHQQQQPEKLKEIRNATRDNNVYIIMEKLTPKGNEGYYVALISNAMAAAQVTIGIFFGRITERYLDNDINNGFFYASVVSCVWISLVTLLEMSMGYIPEIYSSDD
eukprot:jgi/Bigna1/138463/aug1.45_g13171